LEIPPSPSQPTCLFVSLTFRRSCNTGREDLLRVGISALTSHGARVTAILRSFFFLCRLSFTCLFVGSKGRTLVGFKRCLGDPLFLWFREGRSMWPCFSACLLSTYRSPLGQNAISQPTSAVLASGFLGNKWRAPALNVISQATAFALFPWLCCYGSFLV